jgi:hypothetical protein
MTIDPNGTLWTSNGGWQHAPAPTPWKPTASVAAVTDTTWYITLNDGSIWYYNGSSYTTLPGTASGNIAVGNGGVYVIGNGTNKSVYHWNGTSWDFLIGFPTASQENPLPYRYLGRSPYDGY